MSDFLFTESPEVMVGFASAGSACCVWRDALTTYVISAAHVLSGLPADTRVRWISADLSSSGGGTALDSLNWLNVPGGKLDAGLVQMDDPGPFRVGGPYPRGSRVLHWDSILPGLVVAICGKHGSETATFHRKRPAGDAFEGHIHGRLLQFQFLTQSTTDAGDSGAAVISLPEGMLVGMHVALHRELGVPYSFVVPAGDIQEAFGTVLPAFDLRP